ncbi:MAG: hypothetical protein CBB68_14830 [Rhodospirillaceae bacterium TMED8]|nr:MAG: hypothetical protein CBB68_14830 [Rhodospirillaceae bacterium TMED8]
MKACDTLFHSCKKFDKVFRDFAFNRIIAVATRVKPMSVFIQLPTEVALAIQSPQPMQGKQKVYKEGDILLRFAPAVITWRSEIANEDGNKNVKVEIKS